MHDDEWPPGLSRRRFLQLSAATGGALALPGQATATATAPEMTPTYRYVTTHTPADYAVPTLVELSAASGLEPIAARHDDVHTTAEPRPAAYARLTTAEAEEVAALPSAETLSHSPGSNPFWRLGQYPLGVFPAPERATGFVDFEQMIDGLAHLESTHPERLNFYALDGDGTDDNPHAAGPDVPAGETSGRSPGHLNYLTQRADPKGIYVAEVTAFDDDVAFADKEKVFYSLSLHGLERAGAEAGCRFIERLLRGEEPETARLLNDVVLIFCFTNPDGWVAKHPQYESGWQLAGPDQGAPVAPVYERGNADVFDTNRQYPTVGWITTAHYPAEPTDPAARSAARVPDALSIVEHFRTYERLNYGADLHGMLWSAQFVLGLISQDQFDAEQLHELYEMNRVVDDVLEDAMARWTTAADIQQTITGEQNPAALGYDLLPEQAFDYGGIWDTIGYTVTGAMGDWMAHPPITDDEGTVVGGGLDMTTMDFEMAYSHMVGANAYNPEIVRMQVLGYTTAIRTIAKYAYENTDTPSASSEDSFAARVETGGESVAYVTSEAVERSSQELSFQDGGTSLQEADRTTITFSGTIPAGGPAPAATTARHTFDTADFAAPPEMVLAELSWTPAAEDLEFVLEYPDGDRASARTANNPETLDKGLHQQGEYALIVESYAAAGAQYEITAAFPQATLTEEGEQTYDAGDSETETDDTRVPVSVPPSGVTTATHTVEHPDCHSLTVDVHAHDALLDAALVSPAGEVVRTFEAVTEDRVGGRCGGGAEWFVKHPAPGEWTVRLTNQLDDPADAAVRFGTLASTSPHPDPEPALGYEQTPYETSPFAFFADLDAAADGAVDPVSIDDVADGALAAYDHAVVIHDDGADDDAYLRALEAFLDAGGNLVCTDTGVRLVCALEHDLVANIAPWDVTDERVPVAHLAAKHLDHPLLAAENPPDGPPESVRPIQKQLWKIAPLGYSTSSEAPMSLVDREAFAAAGGVASVAGTTEGRVAAGSITRGETDPTGVHVVGSLLPPANQSNLHPFGLLDYTTSLLGYLLLTNALGFTQVRETADGERRFGYDAFVHPDNESGGGDADTPGLPDGPVR